MTDLSTIKQNRQLLLDELKKSGAKIRGNSIHCPWHEDNHSSAGIFANDSTGWKYKCHSCGFSGDVFDVIARRDGITLAEAIKRFTGQSGLIDGYSSSVRQRIYTKEEITSYLQTLGTLEKFYRYKDEQGKDSFFVARLKTSDGKIIRPFMPNNGGYTFGLPPVPRLLYNLPTVIGADTIIICEGEKCVDCLTEYGFVATTSVGGAKSARNSDWGPLSGKNVIIWPDNDLEGKRYADDIQQILTGLGTRVSILEPRKLDLADGEDCFDFVTQLKTIGQDKPEITNELQKVINSASPKGPADKLNEKIEKIITGELVTIKFPFRWTGFLSNALLPGTLTIICGGIGASKSFMLLQCLMYWIRKGIRACCYMLEEDTDFHTQRALAQLAGISKLTDFEFVCKNHEIARQAMSENYDFLNDFGYCIETSPTSQQTQPQIAEWILSKAKQGNRIICIDPITAAAQAKEIWIVDNTFLQAIKRTATDYNVSIVMVTHPIKTVSAPDMNQLAGSAAYARFVQTILWLENHEEKTNLVEGDCGTTETGHNRTLHLLKCRNGAGQGKKIAFEFNVDSLTLRELGLIRK